MCGLASSLVHVVICHIVLCAHCASFSTTLPNVAHNIAVMHTEISCLISLDSHQHSVPWFGRSLGTVVGQVCQSFSDLHQAPVNIALQPTQPLLMPLMLCLKQTPQVVTKGSSAAQAVTKGSVAHATTNSREYASCSPSITAFGACSFIKIYVIL